MSAHESSGKVLVGRVGAIACAIPIEHVIETMRPQPVRRLGDAPPHVRGVAVIRGEPTPVIDTAVLIGATAGTPTRLVLVRAGDRRVALEFDAVVDVRPLAGAARAALPPLLRGSTPEVVAAIAAADAQLFVVLDASRALVDP
jgi:purine-binding chemotaxis protein CheW